MPPALQWALAALLAPPLPSSPPGAPKAPPVSPASRRAAPPRSAAQPSPAPAPPAPAGSPSEEERRREIEEIRRMIQELQRRLDALEAAPPARDAPAEPPAPEPPAPEPAPPEPAPPASEPGGAATLLPNISAVGNLQFRAGDRKNVPDRGRFNFDEFELSLQDQVTPRWRYDVFLSAAKEEDWSVGLEEGYLTATSLLPRVNLRAGRIRTPIGKFNPLHPHLWLTITPPSAYTALLGPEGLTADGAELSYLLPTGDLYTSLSIGRWQTTSETEDGLGFGGGENGAYGARLLLGKEVGRDRELELGFSHYQGRGAVDGFGRPILSISGADLTYRSYPGADRRLHLTAELLAHRTGNISGEDRIRLGGYLLGAYRWNRYWEAGARADYTRLPFPLRGREYGGSLFLTRYLTEQTSVRLQYTHANSPGFGDNNQIYFQVLFGSGPHVHPLR